MVLSLANGDGNLIFYLELVKYRLRGDVHCRVRVTERGER